MAAHVNDGGWPSHAQELSRKALTLLERQVQRNADNDLSVKELCLVAETIYDVTEGLTPRNVSDTILAIIKEIRG